MSYYRRLKAWLRRGAYTTERESLLAFTVLGAVTTVLLYSNMSLWRENKERVQDVRNAVITSCRDANEVRSEIRYIIQEIKNIGFNDPNIETVLQRYDRLTRAQAALADERCIPLRISNQVARNQER